MKSLLVLYGPQRFITMQSSILLPASCCSLSYSKEPATGALHPIYLRFTSILSFHLCLKSSKLSLPFSFQTQTLNVFLTSPMHATCPSYHRKDKADNIVQIWAADEININIFTAQNLSCHQGQHTIICLNTAHMSATDHNV